MFSPCTKQNLTPTGNSAGIIHVETGVLQITVNASEASVLLSTISKIHRALLHCVQRYYEPSGKYIFYSGTIPYSGTTKDRPTFVSQFECSFLEFFTRLS